MHTTGEYSIGDLAEVFAVARPTVYRTLGRVQPCLTDRGATIISPCAGIQERRTPFADWAKPALPDAERPPPSSPGLRLHLV